MCACACVYVCACVRVHMRAHVHNFLNCRLMSQEQRPTVQLVRPLLMTVQLSSPTPSGLAGERELVRVPHRPGVRD